MFTGFFRQLRYYLYLAEREGFEPPDLLQSTVFKTAAFDRSAISPGAKLGVEIKYQNIFSDCPNFFGKA